MRKEHVSLLSMFLQCIVHGLTACSYRETRHGIDNVEFIMARITALPTTQQAASLNTTSKPVSIGPWILEALPDSSIPAHNHAADRSSSARCQGRAESAEPVGNINA